MAIQGLPQNAPDTEVSPKSPVASGPSGSKSFTGIMGSMFDSGRATTESPGTKGDVEAGTTPNPVRA